MDSQQRDELTSLIQQAVARQLQHATSQSVDQLSQDEAEASARIRERLTAVETELRIHRWVAGIALALALALLRFWPR